MHRLSIYSPLSKWKAGDSLASPYVHITVGTHSSTEGEHVLLSSQLMSDQEIDEAVDQMISELEEFRKMAKKEINSLKSKMRNK